MKTQSQIAQERAFLLEQALNGDELTQYERKSILTILQKYYRIIVLDSHNFNKVTIKSSMRAKTKKYLFDSRYFKYKEYHKNYYQKHKDELLASAKIKYQNKKKELWQI